MVYKKVQKDSACLETFLCGPLSLVMSAVVEADMLQLRLPLYFLCIFLSHTSNIRLEQVGIFSAVIFIGNF